MRKKLNKSKVREKTENEKESSCTGVKIGKEGLNSQDKRTFYICLLFCSSK